MGPKDSLIINYSSTAGFAFASAIPTETVRVYCGSKRPILFEASEDGVKIATTLERVEGI